LLKYNCATTRTCPSASTNTHLPPDGRYNPPKGATLKFPHTLVIYLDEGPKDESLTLDLQFPDGSSYTYKAKAFILQKHSLQDLESKRLYLLLPFTVLRFRQAASGKNVQKAQKAAKELKEQLAALNRIIERGLNSGNLNESDAAEINYTISFLCERLYQDHKKFKEVLGMGIAEELEAGWQNTPYMQMQRLQKEYDESKRQLQEERRRRQELERKLREYEASGSNKIES
jgi:hypothetical protein